VRGRITKERASPLRKTNVDLEDAGEEARLGDGQGAMEKKKSAWSPCCARDDEEELVDDS
jgi:hypothetical protein